MMMVMISSVTSSPDSVKCVRQLKNRGEVFACHLSFIDETLPLTMIRF